MLSSPGKLLVPRLGSNLLSGLLSIALGLLLGLLCLLAAFRPRSARRKVAVVESFLRVRWASETNLSLPRGYYYETDAGLSFRVPERGTCLIDPGQRYRLYYAVGGQELVNLEPVGSTFSFRSPESVSALATPFSASPFHLSAAEVSAILGVPVTPEELNAQPHASVPGMTMVSFANLAAGVRAIYGFRLGGRALKHSQLWEALIRRRGERLPAMGDEAYLVPNGFVYVSCGDVLLLATVRMFQPGQVVMDRKLTLALAQALVQKLGR